MAAPVVQTLAQVMADLDPAYAGQQSVITKQQANVGATYDAQRAGLTAAKGQGFVDINNQATGRGLSFSGIPLDEQATYLSTKYLPGVQAANAQQNADTLTLEGQAAGLETDKRKTAMGTVSQQQSDLNSWNMQQESIAATARENELNRAAQAAESAASRNFQASQAAQDRAFTASQNAPTGPTNGQLLDGISAWTKGKTGGDGKLSPSDFKAGYSQWLRLGGPADPGQYTAAAYQYINSSHAKDYAF